MVIKANRRNRENVASAERDKVGKKPPSVSENSVHEREASVPCSHNPNLNRALEYLRMNFV